MLYNAARDAADAVSMPKTTEAGITDFSGTTFPPIFVMNLYYTAIGIARSLRSCPVKVYGLFSEKDSPGTRCRFFKGTYQVPNGRDEPEKLCERLLELRQFHSLNPVIFPTRDFDVLFLHRYRDRLAPFYRLPHPAGLDISQLMDKFTIANIALNNQIPTPKTRIYACAKEIEQDVKSVCLPLVLKPRFAYYWRQNGAWTKVGARKAVFVESLQQLCQECQQLKSVPGEILAQEFIRGVDSDIVVFCCYVGQDGQLLAYFTARKLRQCPPLFGTGSVVELADVPSIIPPSLKLLKACGYTGLAEIEFKYDRARDQFFFIEINPRHWDQHELGNLVHVNLSWVAYQDMVGLSPERQFPSTLSPNSKWIAERELAFSLIGNSYRKVIALRSSKNPMPYFAIVSGTFAELVDILRGRKIFSILRLSDPVPGILMCFSLMRELSKRIWVSALNFLSTDRRAV